VKAFFGTIEFFTKRQEKEKIKVVVVVVLAEKGEKCENGDKEKETEAGQQIKSCGSNESFKKNICKVEERREK
jgi:hypothetical protein